MRLRESKLDFSVFYLGLKKKKQKQKPSLQFISKIKKWNFFLKMELENRLGAMAASVPSTKLPEVPAAAEQEGSRPPGAIFPRCVALAPAAEKEHISLTAFCRPKSSNGGAQ